MLSIIRSFTSMLARPSMIWHYLKLLLQSILHDWSDEDCIKILKQCKKAVPSKEDGGKLILIEMVVNFNLGCPNSAETQLLIDMHKMVHTTGKQRNEDEWKKVFINAGFTGYKIMPEFGLRSVIEVYHWPSDRQGKSSTSGCEPISLPLPSSLILNLHYVTH